MVRDNQPAPPSAPWALRSRHIATPDGPIDGAVVVAHGRIRQVVALDEPLPTDLAQPPQDLGNLALLPGFIDAHVHLNDPRPGEPWEGFDTGTRAAAAGGVTTVVDMPLNSLPVTTSVEALHAKQEAARGRLHTDVGLYAGLVPGNLDALPGLLDAGVLGVKCFLCDSGLPEFPATDHETLRSAMRVLAEHGQGVPLLAHAERTTPQTFPTTPEQRRCHAAWADSRPGTFEQAAVRELLELAQDTGARLHVVHVADAGAVDLIRRAKAGGAAVTAETCPHYLAFTQDDVADGDTRFKCAPPIRDAKNQAALWQGLFNGTLDLVASDHSPCPPGLKSTDTGDFFTAWGGIASLQLGPAVTWTHARPRGATLEHLADWWAHGPARLLGLDAGIAPGCPANLVAFDPDAQWTIDADALHHRHAVTPYAGARLQGRAEQVWLHGRAVLHNEQVLDTPHGVVLRRSDHD
ncbi:MAG: allantoinase AllB [Planctomycetota bacterium]